MLSASARKSVKEVSRRPARMVFTVATLALAVASFGFLAVPTLIDGAMQEESRAGRLADVTLSFRPLPLTAEQLDALAALPNVEAVEARSGVDARVLVGERRARAYLIGVRDSRPPARRPRARGVGPAARPGEVTADVQDANVGLYGGDAGDTPDAGRRRNGDGRTRRAPGQRRARSLPGGELVQDEDVIVLYATTATVAALSGEPGYNRLALRLRDTDPAAAAATVEAVRGSLGPFPASPASGSCPRSALPATGPGRRRPSGSPSCLTVITLLALLSALVLISNTMTTLVAEQTGRSGSCARLGARSRQVAVVYLRTALLLGLLGAVLGAALGVVLANLLAGYFGSTFWAIDVGAGVDPTVLLLSLVRGPARRRRLQPAGDQAGRAHRPPRGARVERVRGRRPGRRRPPPPPGALPAADDADRAPRRRAPEAAQPRHRVHRRARRREHARGPGRRGGGDGELAHVVERPPRGRPDRHRWAQALRRAPSGPSSRRRGGRGTAGARQQRHARGPRRRRLGRRPRAPARLPARRRTLVQPLEEEQARARVAVVERNIADAAGIEVGETVAVETAAGDVALRVVGIAKNQQEEGPRSTCR